MSLGRFVGRLLYVFLSRYRTVALHNLHCVFGREKSEAQIRRIARESFENLGLFAVESIRIPRMTKRVRDYIVMENEESLFNALRAKRGVVLIISHFGNWEWMGVAAAARMREKGAKINAVARPLGNPFLYRYVVQHLRGATSLRTIDKKGAVREVMKLLDQNEFVCILIDQHERRASIPVPYFGMNAWTTTLPAVLALRRDVPAIPVFSFRRKGKPTLMKVGEPFPIIRTGSYDQDVYENTKQYLQAIEAEVRKRPGDWLWMHRRWRESVAKNDSRSLTLG